MDITAKHVIFSGRVQGVGFRYTTRRIADRNDLVGWVKNLPDGTVEAFFQGSNVDIQVCLEDLKNYFSGYLRDMKIIEQPMNPQYIDFQITF